MDTGQEPKKERTRARVREMAWQVPARWVRGQGSSSEGTMGVGKGLCLQGTKFIFLC